MIIMDYQVYNYCLNVRVMTSNGSLCDELVIIKNR